MKEILEELAASKKVLVTGSFARGEQTDMSDIDFQVKTPRECVIYGTKNPNMEWVKNLLAKWNVKWNSTRVGYMSTINSENNIPIQMEFYDAFDRTPKAERKSEVEIFGVKFKTH